MLLLVSMLSPLWMKLVSAALDEDTIDMLTPVKQLGEACGYESCPVVRPDEINVHLVPATHFEVGHMASFEDHYTGRNDYLATSLVNAKRAFDHVISQLWADHHKKFTVTDMSYFFHWWSKRDPTVRRMVYELLRQGRLSLVGGGLVSPDEGTTSYHGIIETFTYSLRKINSTFLNCGRPLVTWQGHTLGHSREMSSLMAQMGFDGHFISPISFDDFIHRMNRQGLEFLWRGSDDLGVDSDIYTHVLFDGIQAPPGFCFSTRCDDQLIVTSDSAFKNSEERAKEFIESIKYRQRPHYNTSNVMVVMGTPNAYHDASTWYASIDKLIAATAEMRSPKDKQRFNLFYSTPYCYLRALHEAQPKLETKQDDFLPIALTREAFLTGLYSTSPAVKLLAREALGCLQIAKQLQVLARLYNNDDKFEELQWIYGIFQDHSVITGDMRESVRKNYIQRLDRAMQGSTLIMKQAFNKLRESPTGTLYFRCQFNMSVCQSGDRFVLVYNPLAWPVTMPVRVPSFNKDYKVSTPNGTEVPTAMLRIPEMILRMPGRNVTTGHEMVFIAENIPPLGFRSYFIESPETYRSKRECDEVKKPKHTKRKRQKRSTRKEINDIQKNNRELKRDKAKKHNKNSKTALKKAKKGNLTEQKSVAKDRSNKINNNSDEKNNITKVDENIYTDKNSLRDKLIQLTVSNKAVKTKYFKEKHSKEVYKLEENNEYSTEVDSDEESEKFRDIRIKSQMQNSSNESKRFERKVYAKDESKRGERSFVEKNESKRPIIKKINKSKKYIVRQANQKIDEQPLISEMDSDYEYFDEDLRNDKNSTNITNIMRSHDTFDIATNPNSEDNYTVPEIQVPDTATIGNETSKEVTEILSEETTDKEVTDQMKSAIDEDKPDVTEQMKTAVDEGKPEVTDQIKSAIEEDKAEVTEQMKSAIEENTSVNLDSTGTDTQTVAENVTYNPENNVNYNPDNNVNYNPGNNLEYNPENNVEYNPENNVNSNAEINSTADNKIESQISTQKAIQLDENKDLVEPLTDIDNIEVFQENGAKEIEETTTQKFLATRTTVKTELLNAGNGTKIKTESKDIERTIVPIQDKDNDARYLKSKMDLLANIANMMREKSDNKYAIEQNNAAIRDKNKKTEQVIIAKIDPSKVTKLIDTGNKYPIEHTTVKIQDIKNNSVHDVSQILDVIYNTNISELNTSNKASTETNVQDTNKGDHVQKLTLNDFVNVTLKPTRRKGMYEISNDNFIENKYVKLTMDPKHRKINGLQLSNGINISLDIQFYYYVSDDPQKLLYNAAVNDPFKLIKIRKSDKKPGPGVNVFRTVDNKAIPILDYLDVKVFKTPLVQEVQYQYADHASMTVRLYKDSPTVETDWIVAPVPYGPDLPEGFGTDIIIRYMTDLDTGGVLYTDSNGRQTMKRVRDMRPMYEPLRTDVVAGNYYPVTSKIYILDEDRNIRFSIFPDRAQGGASLRDGEIEMMLQRRIHTEDYRDTRIFANETDFDQPVWVRGKHHLYLSKSDYRPNRIFEKKFAKELQLPPIVLTSLSKPYGKDSNCEWSDHINEMTFIKTKLPLGVHLLSLQEWNDNTLLIRLENYLEKSDLVKTGIKTVFLRNLFTNIVIKDIKETTLGANIWMKDFMPLLWKKKENFVKSFKDFYASGRPVEWADDDYTEFIEADLDKGVILRPQQIRTFVCAYEYLGNFNYVGK